MKYKKRKKSPTAKAMEVADAFTDKSEIETDPLGSWTGKPLDENEMPVQDADDL